MFKSISKELKDRMLFAEIRDSHTELISLFKIDFYPKVCFLLQETTCEFYPKTDMNKLAIMNFLRDQQTNLKKQPIKPLEVSELTLKNTHCSTSDNSLCFIAITSSGSLS